jgi:hypothetical protein
MGELHRAGRYDRISDDVRALSVTTGNTMARCVIIGERSAEALNAKHKL